VKKHKGSIRVLMIEIKEPSERISTSALNKYGSGSGVSGERERGDRRHHESDAPASRLMKPTIMRISGLHFLKKN